MKDASCENHLGQLSFLIGKWNTHGMTIASTDSPAVVISGTDIYEWGLGGQFIVHTVAVQMGDEKVETAEYIGSEGPNAFIMYAFDNKGKVSMMMASLNQSGNLVIQGDGMRSVLQYSLDGHEMTAIWERSEGNSAWKPWMTMNFNKE